MKQKARVQCRADSACPYPGPVCEMHRRMQNEPDMFASSTATKRMEELFGLVHGDKDLFTEVGRLRLPVYHPPVRGDAK